MRWQGRRVAFRIASSGWSNDGVTENLMAFRRRFEDRYPPTTIFMASLLSNCEQSLHYNNNMALPFPRGGRAVPCYYCNAGIAHNCLVKKPWRWSWAGTYLQNVAEKPLNSQWPHHCSTPMRLFGRRLDVLVSAWRYRRLGRSVAGAARLDVMGDRVIS